MKILITENQYLKLQAKRIVISQLEEIDRTLDIILKNPRFISRKDSIDFYLDTVAEIVGSDVLEKVGNLPVDYGDDNWDEFVDHFKNLVFLYIKNEHGEKVADRYKQWHKN